MPFDSDRDGVVDQYNITMRIKKPSKDLALQQANLILAFDYEVSDLIKMKMEGIANIAVSSLGSSNINAGKIGTQGNLVMIQPNAMKQLPYDKVREVYYDNYFNNLESTSIN